MYHINQTFDNARTRKTYNAGTDDDLSDLTVKEIESLLKMSYISKKGKKEEIKDGKNSSS